MSRIMNGQILERVVSRQSDRMSEDEYAALLKQGNVHEIASSSLLPRAILAAPQKVHLSCRIVDDPLPPGAAIGASLPLRLVSEKNQREHWSKRHARVKAQRQQVYEALSRLWDFGHTLGLPLTVRLTRIAPRALDDDNNVIACSGCRDGVSDWLAGQYLQGQDRQDGLMWLYAQRRVAPEFHCVEITIERPKKRKNA